jgi:hypothetical protein
MKLAHQEGVQDLTLTNKRKKHLHILKANRPPPHY